MKPRSPALRLLPLLATLTIAACATSSPPPPPLPVQPPQRPTLPAALSASDSPELQSWQRRANDWLSRLKAFSDSLTPR